LVAPDSPDVPSLFNAEDYQNKALTERAIGRKRSGMGLATAVVFLPEDQTVSGVVGKAVAQGFRQAGYRVLDPGVTGFAEALPVRIRVVQFWSWFSPGFAPKVSNRAAIEITSPLPAIGSGIMVNSDASERVYSLFDADWNGIIAEGTAKLTENVKTALQNR
jgi:hypothetical protein